MQARIAAMETEADQALSWHPVCGADDLETGGVLHVETGGLELALFRLDDGYHATSDICTHMRSRLSDGYVKDGTVQCPLHFGRFDIRTGQALSAPCKKGVRTFATKVDAGRVWVGM